MTATIYSILVRPARRSEVRDCGPITNTRSLYRERLYRPIFKSPLTIAYATSLVLRSTAYTAALATY